MLEREIPIETFKITNAKHASVVLEIDTVYPPRVMIHIDGTSARRFVHFPIGRVPELASALSRAYQQAVVLGLVKEPEDA
jgi:hypothetical protein